MALNKCVLHNKTRYLLVFHYWSLFCSFCRLLCHFTSPPLYWQLSDVMYHVIPNQIYVTHWLPSRIKPNQMGRGLGDGCVDHESNAIPPPPPPILTRNRHHWALPYSIIIMNSKSYLLFNHSSHEVKVCYTRKDPFLTRISLFGLVCTNASVMILIFPLDNLSRTRHRWPVFTLIQLWADELYILCLTQIHNIR